MTEVSSLKKHKLSIFFVSQVSLYITEGLERARDSLTEAAVLRERFVLGTSVSRRVAAAAASAVITLSFFILLFTINGLLSAYPRGILWQMRFRWVNDIGICISHVKSCFVIIG